MKMLSRQRPRPSMLTAIPRASKTPVNFSDVNCEPWSLLKTSGRPRRNARPQCLQAEVHLQRHRHRPAQHEPVEPVHHRHQVHKPFRHPHVGGVRTPHLVDARPLHLAQQVGIDLVPFARLTQLQPHHLHQARHPLSVHWVPGFRFQLSLHGPPHDGKGRQPEPRSCALRLCSTRDARAAIPTWPLPSSPPRFHLLTGVHSSPLTPSRPFRILPVRRLSSGVRARLLPRCPVNEDSRSLGLAFIRTVLNPSHQPSFGANLSALYLAFSGVFTSLAATRPLSY